MTRQVGGNHYSSDYQHWDWALDISLPCMEYAATKYVSRWWKKKGTEDLLKAASYVKKLIEASRDEKIVPTGILRGSDWRDGVYDKTLAFSVENDLEPEEGLFMSQMALWVDEDDLTAALATLDRIIATAQGRAGRSPVRLATAGHPPAKPPCSERSAGKGWGLLATLRRAWRGG